MNPRPEVSLAERKRQLVSNELTEAALQLLARNGFDVVTIDEIAATAGVSRRTFFRYFASKEDVVVQFLTGMGADIRAELAARPAEERPSVALRHAIWVPIAACADHGDRALRVVQLILRTPALLARYLERQAQWRTDLAAELGGRLGLDLDTDLYPQLAVGMALSAFDAVLQRWSDSDGAEDPAGLTDRAFTVIAPALDVPGGGASGTSR
ncbi:TetR family transcriptional regulator [Micromonospora sp. S4605]|uniref:TetR family transcriptional regulator n=1 Tax=Micromonospora sp. S4605 TaxID=1420897 RepID=UPI000D6F383C|nr:TetR family transcriptional regulator [Micromonospora sp. S4605]PWU52368.1 TetR family transcriptional regulator [Micromonospora sp. S4605]